MNVLITGGTGFLGRHLVRALLERGAQRVCCYSRGEHAQAAMREEFNDDQRLRWLIGDVRDKDRLRRAMDGVQTVIHAAALKRIEVGAYCPDEMIRTNVDGASNVVDVAWEAGVESAVMVSTDKAYRPVSPYGLSKALAESLFLAANEMFGAHGPNYSVVRFGNIWGSTGSVVPRWRALIAAGAKVVPVTDPDCTRFFQRIDEAVDLILSAVHTRALHIPDWLPAYRLGDLADAMGVEMDVQGLPAWEKKSEGLRDGLTSDAARRMTLAELQAVCSQATYG